MVTGTNTERIDGLRAQLPDAQVWANDAAGLDT